MKHLATVVTAATLLFASNAWAENCMYQYSKQAKLAAATEMDGHKPVLASPIDREPLLLSQVRGLDDAKRARLLGKKPIQSIVMVHN